jgi:hypothetical protein
VVRPERGRVIMPGEDTMAAFGETRTGKMANPARYSPRGHETAFSSRLIFTIGKALPDCRIHVAQR